MALKRTGKSHEDRSGAAQSEHPEQIYPEHAKASSKSEHNWGPWLDTDQLERAGLKANRVSIPGDWDHEGVYVCAELGAEGV